jgi:predicted N-acyltransferase
MHLLRAEADAVRVERLDGIERVDEGAWRALEPQDFPFFDFEFLRELERSGSIGPDTGWEPVYLVCTDEKNRGRLLGALCSYLKSDSYGEYIFDWEWARAYERYGLPYYPKLVAAVPFTPATGPKLLVRPDVGEATRTAVASALLEAAQSLGDELRVSSAHALFLPEWELEAFAQQGFAVRHSLQFHWRNPGYCDFSDYLDALISKRRRQIRRERRQLGDEGLIIERLTGETLNRDHAATMYQFYVGTFETKWGFPYLTEAFFHEAFRTMGDRILLVLAREELSQRPVAGALFFFKGRSLYGRYWGTAEKRRNLHFELCYYQGIEFAIERGITLFEAGAQGEHKLTRGFLPTLTYSAHHIRHPAFRRAIEQYIAEEKELIAGTIAAYAQHDPYKR